MVRFSSSLFGSLLAACVAGPSVAWAAAPDTCDAAKTFGERFIVRYRDGCWKQDADLTARARAVDRAFEKSDQTPEARIRIAGEQAAKVSPPAGQGGPLPHIENLRQAVAEAKQNLATLPKLQNIEDRVSTDSPQFRYPALQLGYWDPFENVRRGFGERYLQEQKCETKGVDDQDCARVYAEAVRIGDAMLLMQHTIETLRLPLRAELKEALDRRKARWNSYLYDSQFQYFWELGLNRWLEESCPDGLNSWVSVVLRRKDECAALKADTYGNPLDWREPPSFRAIALHPDIGFMYDQNDPKGSRTNVALVFQWFGYQWWKWDDTTNKVKDLRGLSVVSTVADVTNGNAVGIGIQGQYGKYALSVTSHGGKPVFTLSLNLLERLSELDEQASDVLRRALPKAK
jgi:hypothetical protein